MINGGIKTTKAIVVGARSEDSAFVPPVTMRFFINPLLSNQIKTKFDEKQSALLYFPPEFSVLQWG